MRKKRSKIANSNVLLFPYGVSRNKIERAIHNLGVSASIARKWDDADVVLTLKTLERKESEKLKSIAAENVPIYSIKTNTTAQIMHALKDIFALPSMDAEEIALREASEAIYKVLLDNQPIELTPQTSYVRRMQHQLAEQHRVMSRSTGMEPNRRIVFYRTNDLPYGVRFGIGRFITVEGIEGSGKSTLLAGLVRELGQRGVLLVATREPGGTPLGNRLRSMFVNPNVSIDPLAEAFVVNASRARARRRRDRTGPRARRDRHLRPFRRCDARVSRLRPRNRSRPLAFARAYGDARTRTRSDAARRRAAFDFARTRRIARARDRHEHGSARNAKTTAFTKRVRDGYLALARELTRFEVLDGTRVPDQLLCAALAAIDERVPA